MSSCSHLDQIRDITPMSDGCVGCLEIGDEWVHLRLCMSCGYVGCCDSSKNQHASGHAHTAEHPIVQSYEPGEDWNWCYVDEIAFLTRDEPHFSHPDADTETIKKRI